jgi:hypothetical protein
MLPNALSSKKASIGTAADLKRTTSDIGKSGSVTAKQAPKPSFKSNLNIKLDLKTKGLSQSVVITPQGNKKIDFTGYNTNSSIPTKTVADANNFGNQTTRLQA